MRWLPWILMLVIYLVGCNRSGLTELPKKLDIEITGSDFEWHIRYAGDDGTIHTSDDLITKRNLTLLVGVPTEIALRSQDYVYNFALPHLDQKEIAVPDLEFSLQFVPRESGDFALEGDQMCGYQHPKLIGKVEVIERKEFERWRRKMQSESFEVPKTN